MNKRYPRPEGSPDLDVPPAAEEQVDAAVALDRAKSALNEEVHLASTESVEARKQRLSTGVLIGVVGVVMMALTTSTSGDARFALSNANDPQQLPTITLPGLPLVLACAVLLLGAAAVFIINPTVLRRSGRTWAGAVAGLATVIGFLTWASSGRDFPFLVNNQLQGTLLLATPLILGALCGLMCERAGVVNVSIEGQMLSSALAAAVVGSITQSLVWGVIAGIAAALLMAAILALFAITYLMDQVVLGVVINLLALGLTSFLFDGLVQPNSAELNSAPLFQPIPIPGLSQIPLLGQVLFSQTIVVYLAVISVAVVWAILKFTPWGLRIRAVGEHPKAADTVGISVRGVRWSAVLAGAIFSGIGGAYFSLGVTGSFNDNITVGNGFIALAALIMGRWRPWLVALMALFFGFANQLAQQVQTMGTPISSDWLKMLPYVATIIAVAGLIGRVRGPAAAGVPYTK